MGDLKSYADGDRLWVALENQKPAGFAVVDTYGSYVHLAELDVDPLFMRRKIGSQLVMQTIDWSRKNGFRAMSLRTFSNTIWSMALYQGLGFRPCTKELAHLYPLIEAEKAMGLPIQNRLTLVLELDTH